MVDAKLHTKPSMLKTTALQFMTLNIAALLAGSFTFVLGQALYQQKYRDNRIGGLSLLLSSIGLVVTI